MSWHTWHNKVFMFTTEITVSGHSLFRQYPKRMGRCPSRANLLPILPFKSPESFRHGFSSSIVLLARMRVIYLFLAVAPVFLPVKRFLHVESALFSATSLGWVLLFQGVRFISALKGLMVLYPLTPRTILDPPISY